MNLEKFYQISCLLFLVEPIRSILNSRMLAHSFLHPVHLVT